MTSTTPSPLVPPKRFVLLDIYRGFAILGIFMVNILVMNVSFAYRAEWEAEQTGYLQRVTFFILETLFYSKFFTIFSLLFGMGVALQMERFTANAGRTWFFLRRFGWLFLMGVGHILLVWSGDILHLYGILGCTLILFFRLPARTLLYLAIGVFLFPFAYDIFDWFINVFSWDYEAPLSDLSRAEIKALKHHGSYGSGVVLRLKEYAYAMGLIYAGILPIALTMMLLGGYLIKAGWLHRWPQLLKKTGIPLGYTLLALLAYRFTILYYIKPHFDIEFGSPLAIGLMTIFQLSDIVISLALLWGLGYLWLHQKWVGLISSLQYVGRMALTNYLFQSIIGYVIMRVFHGYEYFSAAGCVLLVLGIYGMQVIISKRYFQYYAMGPLEWLWRCISYAKWVPWRRQSSAN